MLMSDIQTEKKFQAKIPIAIWDEWEHWLDGRGTLNNTQIFCGLLRLFLASPESLQLKALFGRADELQVAESPAADTLSPEECFGCVHHQASKPRPRPGGQGSGLKMRHLLSLRAAAI